MKLYDLTETEYTSIMQKDVSLAKIAENQIQKKLLDIFIHLQQEAVLLTPRYQYAYFLLDDLEKIEEKEINDTPYTLQDIGDFCFTLASSLEKKILASDQHAGFFMSLLVNNHHNKTKTDEEYILPFPTLKLNRLCYKLAGANVRIVGDSGNMTGEAMESGKIIITGNSENFTCAHMNKGSVQILGNCKDFTGMSLSGGKLQIQGNCGIETGKYMKGGTIKVNGTIETISESKEGGNIYLRNKKIST